MHEYFRAEFYDTWLRRRVRDRKRMTLLEKTVWCVAVAGNYAYESESNPIMTPVKVSLVCRGMRGK